MRAWLLQEHTGRDAGHPGPHQRTEEPGTHHWLSVMCLTGVDYFSTLGYQPGIAAIAAGALAPVATVVLVLVTLFGALPVYRRVARESPHGEGSIAMLERLLGWWSGKLFVLVLLGFAATDFLITMTLSAADATAHIEENPYSPDVLSGEHLWITFTLLALLVAVFLRGFTEAVGIAVTLVAVYLVLNLVVIGTGMVYAFGHPSVLGDWTAAMDAKEPNPAAMLLLALVVFPKLALGLSGFETGVAGKPQVRGDGDDTEQHPAGRIRGARRLLLTAALLMSGYLVTSSLVTAWLVPAAEVEPGGTANGRALSWLAHERLGDGFGTVYDVSTITILWFAGASAMAGLLNLVPRYLPRYGMAPSWARAVRPLVLVIAVTAFVVTWVFDASVDAQGGAYATGVLVLMLSAAVAVAISAHRARERARTVGFVVVVGVFAYTLVANVIERPDGIRIGALFILGIVAVSLTSRVLRSFDLHPGEIRFDPGAEAVLRDSHSQALRVIANEPDAGDAVEYSEKRQQVRDDTHLPDRDRVVFLEVSIGDPSDFEADLDVCGERRHGYDVLTVCAPNVPATIAAILLAVRDRTGERPHVYFEWTEGSPVWNLLRFFAGGEGETAPITREVLRRAEPDRARRPVVHVA